MQRCTVLTVLSRRLTLSFLRIHLLLILNLIERPLVVSGYHPSPRLPDELLEPLGRSEPCRVVARQPSLRNAVAPVLDDVTVIADEQERTAVRQVQLHADQAVCVAGEVMEGDALAKVQRSLIEGLPVAVAKSVWQSALALGDLIIQIELEVVLQIYSHVGASGDAPERRPQLQIVNPNLDVLAIQEQVQPASVIEM